MISFKDFLFEKKEDAYNNYWLIVKSPSDAKKIKKIIRNKYNEEEVDCQINGLDVFIVSKDLLSLKELEDLLKGVNYKIKDKTKFKLK